MTDIIPFLVYFVAFNIPPLAKLQPGRRTAIWAGIAALAVLSCFIHGQGAIRMVASQWNGVLENNSSDPARFWDWRWLPFFIIRPGA